MALQRQLFAARAPVRSFSAQARSTGLKSSQIVADALQTWGPREGLNLFKGLTGHDAAKQKTGLIWDQGQSLNDITSRKFTFAELAAAAQALAGKLASQGVGKGDRVAVMMGRSPELAVTALAIWSLGAVYLPLFTAFGYEAITQRCVDAAASAVISDSPNAHKLGELSPQLQSKLKFMVATTAGVPAPSTPSRHPTFCVDSLLAEASRHNNHGPALSPAPEGTPMSSHDPMVFLFTSGTTGKPKAVDIPIRAMASFQVYMKLGLGLYNNSEDESPRYLCSADCGWAYGSYFNLLGPMSLGIPPIYYQPHFSAELALSLLARHKITHYASAPTAFRVIRAGATEDMLARYRDAISQNLRYTSAAGEPLNAELQAWWAQSLGLKLSKGQTAIRDHYGQTEQGMMVNQHWLNPELESGNAGSNGGLTFIPGSMGNPMPGLRVVVLNGQGQEVLEQPGEVAIDTDPSKSPLLWFRGYHNNASKTAERFVGKPFESAEPGKPVTASKLGRYYLTGDVATHFRGSSDGELKAREAIILKGEQPPAPTSSPSSLAASSGHLQRFWFRSRADDVITSSGYRIGPSEIEGALMKHADVAESICVGLPDPEGLRGEVVASFVVFKKGSPSEEIRLKALERRKTSLAAAGSLNKDDADDNRWQMGDPELHRLAKSLQAMVKHDLSAHEQPRHVEFLEALPKTPSGKLQRFLLKGRKVDKLL